MVLALASSQGFEVVTALTFDYGQRAQLQEIRATGQIAAFYQIPHQVISLPWLAGLLPEAMDSAVQEEAIKQTLHSTSETQTVWVPNRNGVFLAIAAAFAEKEGCSHVLYGANAEEGETFSDNTPAFTAAMTEALKYSTQTQVQVAGPVQNMTKQQMLEAAERLEKQGNPVPLDLIWSCYRAGDTMCGQCPSCRLLQSARQQKSA
ncbi:MAG: 7-cyano-7-deazaguanine synthase [Cyanobacteria bacterium]|nr:7-cyano-7-deazaguanine synthase [Cyanobacteriota bacterium]